MAPAGFLEHPAVKKSLQGFIQATEDMEKYVVETLRI
jgi:hypothetical protein